MLQLLIIKFSTYFSIICQVVTWEGLKQTKQILNFFPTVVAVAYKRWSLTRGC